MYNPRILCYNNVMRTKKNRKFLKSGKVASLDFKFTGDEPTWHNCPEDGFYSKLGKCLNFYNYYLDREDYVEIIQEYMKNNSYSNDDIAAVPNVPKASFIFNITGKLCRCYNMGMPEFGGNLHRVKNNILDLISDAKREMLLKKSSVVKNVDAPPKPNVHAIMTKKVKDSVLCELEAMLDEWTEDAKAKIKKMPIASILRGENIPVSFIGPVTRWLEKHKSDYTDAYEKTCPEMVEGYSYLSMPQLRNRIKAIDDMLNEIVLYKSSKKSARKPRVKKAKSADKQVSRLNYLNESEEYCMQSCDPTRIVCAQTMFMFNTKYRKVTIFKAAGPDGFTVQGSTLKGFDETKSYSFTLRKPKEVLPILATKTERQVDKELAKIKTKRNPANGRINKDTILIRTL